MKTFSEFLDSLQRALADVAVSVRAAVFRFSLTGLIVSSTWAELVAQQSPRLAHRWEMEPNLGASWNYAPPKPVVVLDPARFSSAERQVRLAEAQKAMRYANEANLIGRESALQSILLQLETTDENQFVQLSLVSAAIKLADASHASELWEKLRNDVVSRRLIEQALVSWKSPAALAVWRERLAQSHAPKSDLIVAIEGIVAVGTPQDLPALEGLLRSDSTDTALKVIVARAMGALANRGLEDLAGQVTASAIDQHELIVAELLSHHSSEQARGQLVDVMDSGNAAARNVAFAALCTSFSALARELAPQMITQPENNLRRQAVELLNRFDDTDSLQKQAIALADSNRSIRNLVRMNLVQKAQLAELKPIVDQVLALHLHSNSPAAQVQAMLLLVELEERERCPQLVDLLEHQDMEVSLTAAWALQSLVDSPPLLQRIFEFTESVTARLAKQEVVSPSEVFRQAYLFEALGRNRYRPALDSLKVYVPKNGHKMGDLARASAIWAIGKIQEGSQDSSLSKQLAGRMLDQSEDDPEDPVVQFASAVALGWIKSSASVSELEKIVDAPPAPIALARDWSLSQLSLPRD